MKNLKKKVFKGTVLIVSFMGLVLISACKHEEEDAKEHIRHEKMEMETAPAAQLQEAEVIIRKANEGEIGSDAVCLVMCSKFTVKEGDMVADYKGKSYPFGCPACVNPFKENPEKYIK